MLDKIINIRSIAQFKDYVAKGDMRLAKLNLIFADNGRGKSTLCSILRSLQTGQPQYITERKSLGVDTPTYVKLLHSERSVEFTDDHWNTNDPNIVIFDSTFTKDNVYAGDCVEHDQKRNLCRLILGLEGVKLANKVDDLTTQISEATTSVNSCKLVVTAMSTGSNSLPMFMELKPVDDIDAIIESLKADILRTDAAIKNAKDIQNKPLLLTISLPNVSSDLFRILFKTIDNISHGAESRVHQQITDHQMGKNGEKWLYEGLVYSNNDLCPLCGQQISNSNIIEAYRAYFNEEYTALKSEIASLGTLISKSLDHPLISLQYFIHTNTALSTFWSSFITLDLPTIDIEPLLEIYNDVRACAHHLVAQKQQSPLDAITMDEPYKLVMQSVSYLQMQINAYNTALQMANEAITNLKLSQQSEPNLPALQKQLTDLEVVKRRYLPSTIKAISDYNESIEAKSLLVSQKDTAKAELNTYSQGISSDFEQSINVYLSNFGTNFRIANSHHEYVGRTPRSDYMLLIDSKPLDIGDANTPLGTPCFKTALSSGDRSALALAFFLTSLDNDTQMANKIVVFDDPFTSQDRFRRHYTDMCINKLACNALQVIVLSHDAHFLASIQSHSHGVTIQSLQFGNDRGCTVIHPCNLSDMTKSRFMKEYDILKTFAIEHQGDEKLVIQTIRPFTESWLRSHFPGRFGDNHWLGNMIEEITNATDEDCLSHAKPIVSDLSDLNSYTSPYHHADNSPLNEVIDISSPELHAAVVKTLRLIGGSHDD